MYSKKYNLKNRTFQLGKKFIAILFYRQIGINEFSVKFIILSDIIYSCKIYRDNFTSLHSETNFSIMYFYFYYAGCETIYDSRLTGGPCPYFLDRLPPPLFQSVD